jgi:hypothetical protein
MSKRCELQKEYYQANGNYKGSGKYSDDYVMWLENEVLALRQSLVISSFCKCKGGAVGRTVTADFEHQICDRCAIKIKDYICIRFKIITKWYNQ